MTHRRCFNFHNKISNKQESIKHVDLNKITYYFSALIVNHVTIWNKRAFLQRLTIVSCFCYFNCKVVFGERLFNWLRLCEV